MIKNIVFCLNRPDTLVSNFFKSEGGVVTENKERFDIAVFVPGPDISPFLYGEKVHPKSYTNFVHDLEDNRFYRSIPIDKPKIGIGRGGQFLCVMGGGRLYQYVDGHLSNHMLTDLTSGNTMMTVSAHKQEMIPTNKMDILAVAREALEKSTVDKTYHLDLNDSSNSEMNMDIEAAWDPNQNALMFQPRIGRIVEPTTASKNTNNLFLQYVDDWILPKVKYAA